MFPIPFSLETLKDGPTGIIITSPQSPFLASQVSFVHPESDASILAFVDKDNLPDCISTLIQSNSTVNFLNAHNDSILFVRKNDQSFELLLYRLLPHREQSLQHIDWIDVIRTFTKQYVDPKPDIEGTWRWGQIVPEDGSYLCVDCGYIEEFKAGQIFPVCEVCQAGDPTGPIPITEGYWQKI